MSMSMYLTEIMSRAEKQVEAYNLALISNDATKMSLAESNLKDIEAEYAKQSCNEVFAACKKAEDPVVEAIKAYSYPVLGHTIQKKDGVVEGITLTTAKSKQIDLAKFFRYLEKSALWIYDLEKLGCLLCMRTAKELDIPDKEVKMIDRLYYQSEFAKKKEAGAIPTSNTQICKLMQDIIEQILPGKKYKALVLDVKYFLMCYTRRANNKKLSVSVAKFSFVQTLFMDILHRIVCDLKYSVDYKMVKGAVAEAVTDAAKTEEVKAPESKVEEPKAPEPIESEEESESEESEE